ncbi:HAD-IIB family hydrolase [Enterocloster sp. OA13]|uniref:HAD-IIB family hydrolase n=1 Tax=Enterocloster sp. OA13 TaxID=2914161 RepID=UPI00046F750F|nr:HAD-IIB family hydrolase [Enterocloster sp. OA13]
MIKAVFLDIDGTLRDERHGIPASAVQAIGMCRESGIQVVICTGRNLASIQPDVKALTVDGIIAGGGCLILEEGRVRKNLFFQYEEIKEMIHVLVRKEVPFALESQQGIFMNKAASLWFRKDFERKLEGLEPWERQRRREENGIRYEDNMAWYRPGHDAIHKVCIWSPMDEREEMEGMASRAGTIVQQGGLDGRWYLEVLPPGCTKGEAIREWCRMKAVSPSDTISFGDGRNDIEMILSTGIGVAMADGDPELRKRADAVCGTAMEDGIYRELVRRGIISMEPYGVENRAGMRHGASMERRADMEKQYQRRTQYQENLRREK